MEHKQEVAVAVATAIETTTAVAAAVAETTSITTATDCNGYRPAGSDDIICFNSDERDETGRSGTIADTVIGGRLYNVPPALSPGGAILRGTPILGPATGGRGGACRGQ